MQTCSLRNNPGEPPSQTRYTRYSPLEVMDSLAGWSSENTQPLEEEHGHACQEGTGFSSRSRISPSKPVCHDSHAEGAHHAAHAEDGHGDAPDDGAHPRADRLLVALHPGVVEEGAEFLVGVKYGSVSLVRTMKPRIQSHRMVERCVENCCLSVGTSGCSNVGAHLLRSVDDSCVVAKLQRSDDSSGQREQQVACHLLVLLPGWAWPGRCRYG